MAKKKSAPAPAKAAGNRSFITMLGIGLVAGAAIIAYVVLNPKAVESTPVDPTLPLLNPKGMSMGSDTAHVEIVMYGDFECPGCGQFARITEPQVRKNLIETGIARFRFMDFPLPGHPSTMIAHNAAACANAQSKFWEMHDKIYAGQLDWSAFINRKDMNAPKVMKRYAKELSLDESAFATCLEAKTHEATIKEHYAEGQRVGVTGTPNFLIGKKLIPNAAYDIIKAYVDSAIAEGKKSPPVTPR